MFHHLATRRSALLDVVEAGAFGRCLEVKSRTVLEDDLPNDDALWLPRRLGDQVDDLLGQQELTSALQGRRVPGPGTESVNRSEEPLYGQLLQGVLGRDLDRTAHLHSAGAQRGDAGEVVLGREQRGYFFRRAPNLNPSLTLMADDEPHSDATPVVGSS
jgi:hypothetical protein